MVYRIEAGDPIDVPAEDRMTVLEGEEDVLHIKHYKHHSDEGTHGSDGSPVFSQVWWGREVVRNGEGGGGSEEWWWGEVVRSSEGGRKWRMIVEGSFTIINKPYVP